MSTLTSRVINSLQIKLALAFLLVVLVPLGIVCAFAIHTADGLIETIVTRQLSNLATDKQQLLEKWMSERKADLEVVAGSPAVRRQDTARIAELLKVVQKHYQVYRKFIVVDRQGRLLHSTGPAVVSPWEKETWYVQAMAGHRYLSPVYLEGDHPESVFQLAVPILGPDNEIDGAVCATVSTTAIVESILRISLGETGECYLVDKRGLFLAHQDPNRILKDNIAQSESFSNIFRDEQSLIYTDYRRIPVLGVSRTVAGTEWYVVVEQDYAEAFAPAHKLWWTISTVILLTAAGAIAISLGLAHYVAAPIRVLSETAHGLARGQFGFSLPPSYRARRDEIGTLVASFEDMTRQLRERHEFLETRVGVTEAELQRAGVRLQDTIQAAARSDRLAAIGRLAAGVAHEIRTPLASLKLYLQSVHEEITISPEFSEDFSIAMRQVERIQATINHFLNFARPQEPVFAEIDFRRLLDEATMVVRPRANQQKVELTAAIQGDLPCVQGDMRQLGGALVNLMINALEEMPQGGRLQVTIAPDPSLEQGGPAPWVRMDVTDSGPGIQEKDLDIVFEPFFTTKAAGSGLGLAIVRGTVHRHDGIIRIRTAVGTGTTFSILLPGNKEPLAASA